MKANYGNNHRSKMTASERKKLSSAMAMAKYFPATPYNYNDDIVISKQPQASKTVKKHESNKENI